MDIDFLNKLKKGDEKAFEILVSENKDNVYRVALSVVKDPDDAEDVSQNVFLKVYMSIRSFRGDSELSTWMYRIAYNMSLDFLRKHKKGIVKTLDNEEDPEILSLYDETYVPEDFFERRETKTVVREAIASLPDEQRILVELKDLYDFSYEEIASMMNINPGTLKSRLNRGREKIKKYLIDRNFIGVHASNSRDNGKGGDK